MEKENVRDELKKVAPELEKLKARAQNSFSVPENYFDRLPETIQGRIAALHKKEKPGFSLAALFPRLAYIAVTAMIIIFAGYFLILNQDANGVDGFADEMLFYEYMEWYADYQGSDPDFYFDYQEEELLQVYDEIEIDEELINYITDYSYYFMENLLEDSPVGQ